MRLLALSLLLAVSALAQSAAPMNVLFITADDLGLHLSSYGEDLIVTPEIDALAKESTLFETAYVAQASCSPSRSAMFTGLYPHTNGQYGLTPSTGYSLHPEYRDQTIPALLKPAGYRTGILGKLHVAPEDSFPFDFRPERFDTRRVREVARQAKGFFKQTGDQPFFLMVNFTDPHVWRGPEGGEPQHFPGAIEGLPDPLLDPSPRTIFPFQQIDTPEQRVRTAGYYNAVRRLDTGVGMLLDELEAAGLAESTLVIFIGDHGPPFTRGKTTVYESGLRVPFLVRWPGVSKAQRSRALVSTVDILPTILDATGVDGPKGLHGKSLRPVVSREVAPWREYLAGEFHFHGPEPFYPRRAIRDQRWKLIHNLRAGEEKPRPGIDNDQSYQYSRDAKFEGTPARVAYDTFADPPEFELYDLQADPNEFRNLAGQWEYAGIQARLTAALRQWRFWTDDPFLDEDFVERIVREGAPGARQ